MFNTHRSYFESADELLLHVLMHDLDAINCFMCAFNEIDIDTLVNYLEEVD